MPVSWSTTLVLGLLTYCACHEEEDECVVGVVGEPVSLPCLYSGPPLDARNFSLEWRRSGGQVLLRAGWEEGQPTGTDTGTGTARLPEAALQNGDFSLELSAVPALRGPQTFHLTLEVGGEEEEEGPPLCTVCLRAVEEEECIVGVVGEPVSLPCFYSGHQLDTLNFSVEWRSGAQLLLRSGWEEGELVDLWQWHTVATNTTRLPEDALQNGDFSLELSAVPPLREPQNFHMSLVVGGGEAPSAPLCTVCLRTEASFTPPSVQRLDPPEANQTTFLCHSVGGRPKPTVHWLINGTWAPPAGSVTTSTLPMVNSSLYNITSRLLADVSAHTTVTCSVESPSLNQILNATSYGVKVSPVASRASDALWVFSGGLCLGVAVLVVAAIIYQVMLDKSHKKLGKTHRGGRESLNHGFGFNRNLL
ncbi:ICOS ligand [Merluccius polli]|uniref:ICOS ligand n=1 Tax=Merluccius polli TaxID=89951 RepID=A0AA47MU18_MERPO|nr:ICOS ligand [Merluccius polli]